MRIPKYYTQKLRILELISEAPAGSALPTERELAERFGTSRTTIRQAIGELVAEGRLRRTQGSGTFVAEPPVLHVRQLTSFSDDLQGLTVEGPTLGIERVPAEREVAAALGVSPGSAVHRIERVRHHAGEPLAHEIAFLPDELPGLAAELERRGSLYETLDEGYGVRISGAEDEIATALATPAQATVLGVEIGSPLLVVHRTAWEASGRAVEWTTSVFRGDRFRFRARSGERPDPRHER
ncbi:GntR family transcriptional regulator [Leucobacter sp. CSA1]|uniref:GntR family transcriptional regulator n=1 Tax=Leucobacter chromiisoli TaxID=2796471 RepID=A0A934Q717_9MICO|nr:GntR family transcriptional regulator [Leucobacter chromiisoli]MBK0419490.1 GntR family transcriptional regulator [Leucobacter chromiisoli]